MTFNVSWYRFSNDLHHMTCHVCTLYRLGGDGVLSCAEERSLEGSGHRIHQYEVFTT